MQHFADLSPHGEQTVECADIANSYQSSIDMFPHETDHLCDLPIHFDHAPSIQSHSSHVMTNVYKEGAESGHQSPHHQSLLIDEDEYELGKHLACEIELVFHNISYSMSTNSCKDRPILNDISGYAAPGQVLAVMGPSGSGKTTLLNMLSGRLKPCTGEISLNGQKINKQLRRRICYVLQQDIFFPSLTLKQTLMYTARLRLPDSVKSHEKMQLVDRIIEELQLQDCQNTIIGDVSKRGLSGGEKKRANIACELLTNPSVMLIDEPTSGLDSCTAHSLVQILKNFAVKRKKTIVMTIHQPSSQMFYMLDRLLLLTNGQLAYFGNVVDVVPFFNSIGHIISMHYNPAEFILEKVKDVNCQGKIVDAAKSLRKLPKYSESEDKCLCIQTKQEIQRQACADSWKKESLKSIELHVVEENQAYNSTKTMISDNDSGRSSWSETDRSSTFSSHSYFREENFGGNHHSSMNGPKWPTSVMTQIQVLTERNFIEAKHRMLSKLNWIQTIVLAIVAGLIWFQIPRKEETINDIRGWMFFTTTYWMLFGLFQALVSFPSEREVINKERSSGAYRLSSYYIAKMIGELPLTVALPSVFFLVSYPMMGCSSMLTFVSMWFFLIIATICAQSVGLFIGAACCDLEVSVTLSALYSLSTMLFAGYYTSMPPWLSWMRYLSMVYYAFLNMQMVEFGGSPIRCANESSKYKYCQMNANASQVFEVQYKELELHLDLMNDGARPFPIWFNTLILLMFFVVFRSMGYLVLRHARKPTT